MFHVTQVLSSYDVGCLIGSDQFRFMADCFTNGTLLLSISEHILPANRAVKDELTPMIREMRELIISRRDRIGDINKLYDKLLPTLAESDCPYFNRHLAPRGRTGFIARQTEMGAGLMFQPSWRLTGYYPKPPSPPQHLLDLRTVCAALLKAGALQHPRVARSGALDEARVLAIAQAMAEEIGPWIEAAFREAITDEPDYLKVERELVECSRCIYGTLWHQMHSPENLASAAFVNNLQLWIRRGAIKIMSIAKSGPFYYETPS
jgi:hypothetical protein